MSSLWDFLCRTSVDETPQGKLCKTTASGDGSQLNSASEKYPGGSILKSPRNRPSITRTTDKCALEDVLPRSGACQRRCHKFPTIALRPGILLVTRIGISLSKMSHFPPVRPVCPGPTEAGVSRRRPRGISQTLHVRRSARVTMLQTIANSLNELLDCL